MAGPTRLAAFVRGHVQGVGFRWWVRTRALELGLDGYAANLPDGRVHVVAQGRRKDCERLLTLLTEEPSSAGRPGRVDGVTPHWLPVIVLPSGFRER